MASLDFLEESDFEGGVGRCPAPRSRAELAAAQGLPCYVCGQSLLGCGKDELTDRLGPNQVCHRGCYNASHALDRIITKISQQYPEAKERVRQLRRTDAPTWRAIVLGLKADAHGRSELQRSNAQAYVVQMTAFKTLVRRQRVILMTRAQFISYFQQNEGLSAQDSAAKWESDSRNAQVFKERRAADGELMCAVQLAPELLFDQGISRKRTLAQSTDLSDPQESVELQAALQHPENSLGPEFHAFGAAAFLNGASSSAGSAAGPPGPALLGCTSPAGSLAAAPPSVLLPPPSTPSTPEVPAAAVDPPAAAPDAPSAPPARPAAASVRKGQQPQELGSAGGRDAGSCGGSPSGSCEPEAPRVDGRALLNIQAFNHFKRQLRVDLQASLSSYMSPQRGKTWGQVLEAMAAARGVADDKDVQALDISASVKRVNGLSAAVKDLLERKLPVWTFKTAKSEEWQKLLNEAEQAMEQLKEGAEEIIDMVSTVKVSKLMKSLQGGGFPDVLAKLMASAFHAAAGPPGAVRAFGAPLASGVQVFSAGCSDGLGEYMRALLLQPPGDVKVAKDAAAMEQSMKAKTAMMPLTLEKPPGAGSITGVQLIADLSSESLRPWLCLAEAFVSSWGSLRYPLAGVPACLAALDDCIAVVLLPMETLLKAEVSLDVIDDWAKDDRGDDFTTLILRRGEMVYIPFATVCLWTYIPLEGSAAVKRGKVCVQWLPEKGQKQDGNVLSALYMKGKYDALMQQYGAVRPWCVVKQGFDSWFGGLGAGT